MGEKLLTIDVTIRIDKARGAELDAIVRELEASGLTAVARRDRFLIVNGSIEEGRLESLRKIVGVASVRKDRIYKARTPTP